MEKCDCIYLMKGATTIVQVDMADFSLQGGTVVLTMSKAGGEVVRTWEFTEAGVHNVVFEDDFTAGLKCGRFFYEYDIMWHFNGERFAQCLPSPIIVTSTAGGCPHGN